MTLPYGAEQALGRFNIDDEPSPVEQPDRRRWPPGVFPLLMFALTALSTIWVGLAAWSPFPVLIQAFEEGSAHILRRCVLANWQTGLLFSSSLLGILLAHEFGHYCMMRRYGIRSTFPIFIPFPISLFGTCGALIVMDPSRADRKQIFDIGIAGPLAGLVVAVPLAILGSLHPDGPPFPQPDGIMLGQPLIMTMMESLVGKDAMASAATINTSTASPFFMAAWIGFLITGINMMPISQLDGGHVAFGIFGDFASRIAKGTFVIAVVYLIWSQLYGLSIMLLLILMMGVTHPPSSNDRQKIGPFRTVLGLATMTLPLLCIAAKPVHF